MPRPVPAGLRLRVPSQLQELDDDRLRRHGVRVLLKRDDLISPELPGNKWRKLRLNIDYAVEQGHTTLLTFGGAYSNHLRVVAAAGALYGFATIGVVRGEEHRPLNPSLARAAGHGMRLVYLDRGAYRAKHSAEVVGRLRAEFGAFLLLPEGGSNALAVRGAMDVTAEIDVPFDLVSCAVGTGGTLAGIAAGLPPGARAIGFSALKGGGFLNGEVRRLQSAAGVPTGDWRIETGYHFGGFARRTPELDAFVADFGQRHGVDLERVYVAKMLAGLFAMVENGEIAEGATIIAVVTG